MDLKRVQGQESLNPIPQSKGPGANISPSKGPSFQDTLNQVSRPDKAVPTGSINRSGLSGLQEAAKNQPAAALKFSQHAIERMRSRGISFSPEDLGKIDQAIGRAAAKGSRDSLLLMGDSALIVSVKNKTVVTVMDQAGLKDNVFTNIDSTIVM